MLRPQIQLSPLPYQKRFKSPVQIIKSISLLKKKQTILLKNETLIIYFCFSK